MGADDLLDRLNADGIDNLTVIYHDYGGRACAKTIPRERFEAIINHGVVFARANLNFQFDDHQSEGATFLADTGDFLSRAGSVELYVRALPGGNRTGTCFHARRRWRPLGRLPAPPSDHRS